MKTFFRSPFASSNSSSSSSSSSLTPRSRSDQALVKSAVRAATARLGPSSLGAMRFGLRAKRFLRGEPLAPYELRGFVRAVRMWNGERTVMPRAEVVQLARRAFAIVGALRTEEARLGAALARPSVAGSSAVGRVRT